MTDGTLVDHKKPKNFGFTHFDGTHIFWLILLVVTLVVCSYFYRKCGETGRKRFRFTVAGLIFADEIAKWIMLFATDQWTVNYFPLHLCTINIFIIAIHIFRPFKTLDNFLYMICIPAGLAALLFPTWTRQPILNFMHIHSSTIHILLVLYPVMLTAGGDIKPRARRIWQSLLLLIGLAIPAAIVNEVCGTNYMFLAKATFPLTIFEDLLGNYLFGFPILLTAVALVMYVPMEIYRYVIKKEPVPKLEHLKTELQEKKDRETKTQK